MSKFNKYGQGFALVELLLVIFTLAVIGVVGYLVANHVDKKPKAVGSSNTSSSSTNTNATSSKPGSSSKTTTATNPYEGWSKATNTRCGLSFYYPSTWYVVSYIGNDVESGASANASEYAIYASRPTNNIENDACVNIEGGSSYNSSDFKSGSIIDKFNNLEVWQNSSTDDGGLAKAYLITKGQKLIRLDDGNTVVAFAALSCGQGMNVNLSYDQQIANTDYKTAVKILESVTLN